MKKINLEGKRFGMILVIDKAESIKGMARWNCHCDCGKDFVAYSSNLRRAHTRSCGCSSNKKHGKCGTPVYKLWHNIKSRTSNPNATRYERYGLRGIKMCDEWRNDFDVFCAWCIENGYKIGLQIDRIDNDGDYCPDNCRFVTNKENCKNRVMTDAHDKAFIINQTKRWTRVQDSLGNEYKSLAEAGRAVNLTGGAIAYAIKNGTKSKGRYWREFE